MLGIDTENCTDNGGGLNVGWINAGDWMKYYLDAQTSGYYLITGRISGYNSGAITLKFNDAITSNITFTTTNGWQTWKDFSTSVYLSQGKYVMTALASCDAYNINYFDFELFGTGINEISNSIDEVLLFPNPVDSYVTIRLNSEMNQSISIKILDMGGRVVQQLYNGPLDYGLNSLSFSINKSLERGIYFIEIKNKTSRYFKKLMKN